MAASVSVFDLTYGRADEHTNFSRLPALSASALLAARNALPTKGLALMQAGFRLNASALNSARPFLLEPTLGSSR